MLKRFIVSVFSFVVMAGGSSAFGQQIILNNPNGCKGNEVQVQAYVPNTQGTGLVNACFKLGAGLIVKDGKLQVEFPPQLVGYTPKLEKFKVSDFGIPPGTEPYIIAITLSTPPVTISPIMAYAIKGNLLNAIAVATVAAGDNKVTVSVDGSMINDEIWIQYWSQ